MMKRTTRALAGAALAAVLLAGCSSGGGGGDSSLSVAQLLAGSADKSTASTAKLALDVSVDVPGQGSVEITGSGAFDYANNRGVITEHIPSTAGQPAQTIEVRTIGDTVYVKAPGLSADKPWVKTDTSTFNAQNGGAAASDPTQFLDYLRGSSNSVTDEGTDTVRGVHTRKMKAVLDLQKAAEKLPADQRKAVEQAIQQLGTSTIPAEVWIDDQGRLAKMTFSVGTPSGASGSGGGGSLDLTFELFDYGAPVNVTAPPPSEVSSQSV
ncbi:MAG TPA: LppX_LprAFG lipoprotein [Actinomycetota bacterium]|nr:LppX_LprAFG lipoprotein [Actinomycetota bacterium]